MIVDASLRNLLSIVVITDSGAPAGAVETACAAIAGGARTIQLRAKEADTRDLLALALELRGPTRDAGALLIVNDRVDVALAAGADGAHLGDDDLPLSAARSIVPSSFILGRSVDTAAEAAEAERLGADYVGFGPIHPTGSKTDTGKVVGEQAIVGVRRRIGIPIVAIGGINRHNAAGVIRAGADGVAVLSEIMYARDPRETTASLLAEVLRATVDSA